MAQVKGTAVQSSFRYVKERFGDDALAGVLAALPETERAALRSVLASSWYPMPAFLRFMQEAKRQLGSREPDVIRNMGRASCDYGVTGRSAHSLCIHRGDAVCRFEGNWE